MIPSAYVIGGAGSGKSTFMAELTDGFGFGDLFGLHALPNKKNLVTLRGHRLYGGDLAGLTGLYLGRMRDSFPGTDGLDRACSPVGEAWLQDPHALDTFDFLVSEGATLATRRFLHALDASTSLLLVHLYVDPFIADLRFLQRGSSQDPSFVTASATRSANLLADLRSAGASSISINSADPDDWILALKTCRMHLFGHPWPLPGKLSEK